MSQVLSLNTLINNALLFLFLASSAFCAEESTAPVGIIEGIEKLISIDRERFTKKTGTLTPIMNKAFIFNGKEVSMDEDFLQSVFFNSDPDYLALIQNDTCKFLALLDAGLLKSSEGEINNIIIKYKIPGQPAELTMLPTPIFLDWAIESKCKALKQTKELFLPDKIKTTIRAHTFTIPTDKQSCHDTYTYWLTHPHTPYLCQLSSRISNSSELSEEKNKTNEIVSKIESGNRAKRLFTEIQANYLRNLCGNLSDKNDYCSLYLNLSFWNKVLIAGTSMEYLSYICQGVLNKRDISKNAYELCVQTLNKNELACAYANTQRYPSLTPRPSCSETSSALNYSRLFAKYQDCPGNIDNEAVVNFARLIMHFEKPAIGDAPELCNTNPPAIFAKMNVESDNDNAWDMKLCYDDKINNRESCITSIMGDHPTSKYSEGLVIKEILYRSKGADKSLSCSVISKSEYNPILLKFKQGCFAVFEPTNCTATNCPKEIFYNENKINSIKYKSDIKFDYFPISIANERYSAYSAFLEKKKLQSKRVDNFTLLSFFLGRNRNALIHGVGCSEDLLPRFFKKTAFNQCTPLSFIIDGLMEENKNVVLRTGVDDIHSPRLIPWQYVFSAVKNYQLFHPMKTWTMYAIY